MKPAPLRAGLVGLGMMGRHHARVLRHLDGVQLVAVADPRGDTYRVAGELAVLETVDQLLQHDLDYCVVAVPAAAHSAVGHALAKAGVHALIEKPLTPTLTEAVALAEAFEVAGLVAAVGYTERHNPAVLGLRERLQRRELGAIYQVATRRQGPYPTQNCDIGVITDLATHDIDLITWATGQPVAAVAARTVSRSGRTHEDLVATAGELTDGTVTAHLVNWLSPMKERVTVVTGEHGCLVADTLYADLTYYANGSTATQWSAAEIFRGVTEGDVTRYAIAKKEPLCVEHEAFRDVLLGKGGTIASLWEGAQTIAVAEAMLNSAATGSWVRPESVRRS